MSAGRHRSGQVKNTPWGTAAGIVMFISGIPCAIGALAEGSGYSAANSGASSAAAHLGLAAVILLGVPVLILAVRLLTGYSRWKKTLTPEQRLLLSLAELGVLTGAAIGLHHHNREVSERLAASAMGKPRDI